MMIRPSSSPPGSTKTAALFDDGGRLIQPDALLGKGGEGSVFSVAGEPALAVKIYHEAPLARQRLEKLQAMVACRSPRLEAISAWPQSLLRATDAGLPCGVLIPRIVDARPLYDLYGTSGRRQHFPGVRWHHLVLAARNIAAAFDSLHAAGIMVGDVNQGNLLVDWQMCARFIDCDSFQIRAGNKLFACPVGTPHFTPPEMQSRNLRDVARTADHDRFGLAVLMFHLLFVGRHPFAGRYLGDGEMNIEKAISQRRFAYSENQASTLMEPPPYSLLRDDVAAGIAELFERAFRGDAVGRPTGREWVEQLDALMNQRRTCSWEESHVFYDGAEACPWCRIEDAGGPEFFVADDTRAATTRKLRRLEHRLQALTLPSVRPLSERDLAVPRPLQPQAVPAGARFSHAELATGVFLAATASCLLGVLSGWLLLGATLACVLSGAYLLRGRRCQAPRWQSAALHNQLLAEQTALGGRAAELARAHELRLARFRQLEASVKQDAAQFYASENSLEDALLLDRQVQKEQYLASQLIHENVGDIRGMSRQHAALLQSYGIESAQDVDQLRLAGMPVVSAVLLMELMNWREELERGFVFQPVHGVQLNDVVTQQSAVERFKIYQAQKVLSGAGQLETLAETENGQRERDVAHFYRLATSARALQMQLREFESSRRGFERTINRSERVVLAIMGAGPLLGWLWYLLFT